MTYLPSLYPSGYWKITSMTLDHDWICAKGHAVNAFEMHECEDPTPILEAHVPSTAVGGTQ